MLAICISTTSGSECGKCTCAASYSVKMMHSSSLRGLFETWLSTAINSESCSCLRVRAYLSRALFPSPAKCGPSQMVRSVPATGAGCKGGKRWRLSARSLPPGASGAAWLPVGQANLLRALSDEMLYLILEVVALVGVVPVVIMESTVLCRVPSSHVLPNRWRPLIRSIIDCGLKYFCSCTH